MARTPSMTREQCEAALGTRGLLFVTSENKGTVRKWYTARGVPGVFAAGLAAKALAAGYNDVSDVTFERFAEQARKAQAEDAADDNETVFGSVGNHVATIEHSKTVQNASDSKLVEALRDVLGGIDPDAVKQIVERHFGLISDRYTAKLEERLADVQVVRVEVKRADDTEIKVDGHVHPKFAALLKAMASRMVDGRHPNIMLSGPTGSGKTYAVHAAAKALGLEFYTNGALTMSHEVVGFVDANGKYHETPFRKAFGRPAAYLFDEFDSSDNSPLLALCGGLANGHNAFPDQMVERHPDSVIIAAGNTWGHGATSDFVGRNKIDGAIRSRFPVRIPWDYDEKLEIAISGNVSWTTRVQAARGKARGAGLKVIIDPRMSMAGAALIAQGFSEDEAAELTYLADLTKDQRAIVS